ncbi:hypothetical protein ON010_g13817 [Phytophthora cinnamomi]|nr:hypothetical protein ON010_g13817 [Phytophthora cinnamomi]
MRQLQEQQAAFQARLNQAQLEMRLGVQRDQEVRAMKEETSSAQEQEALAERTLAAEHLKLFEAEQRIREAESRLACKPHSGLAELDRRLQDHLTAAGAEHRSAEQAACEVNARLEAVQQTIQAMNLERDRVRATATPQPPTQVKADGRGAPDYATKNPVTCGAINDIVVSGTSTVVASKSAIAKSEAAATKGAAKTSVPRRTSSRKGKKEGADPPSSDPDGSDSSFSDSSDGDSSSSGFSSDSSDDFDLDLTTSTTTKEGTTVWTYLPYINYSAVEKFNEDAFLAGQDEDSPATWKHGFLAARLVRPTPAVCSPQLEPTAVAPVQDHVRSSETPRKFFYRVNADAIKAGIECQKSSKHRERHLRRFIKKLKDTQLKTALQGQKFKSISEVEHALRRHEDIWREEGYDTPPPRSRDFRADDDPQGRFKPRRSGRAFVVQDSEPDPDLEPVALAQGRENRGTKAQRAEPPPVFKTEDVAKEVYSVLEADGWRPITQKVDQRPDPDVDTRRTIAGRI